jgi:hypothetical protein
MGILISKWEMGRHGCPFCPYSPRHARKDLERCHPCTRKRTRPVSPHEKPLPSADILLVHQARTSPACTDQRFCGPLLRPKNSADLARHLSCPPSRPHWLQHPSIPDFFLSGPLNPCPVPLSCSFSDLPCRFNLTSPFGKVLAAKSAHLSLSTDCLLCQVQDSEAIVVS